MPNTREKLISLIRYARRDIERICKEHKDCLDCPVSRYVKDCKSVFIANRLIAGGVTMKTEPKTNADRIRAMSDEELACLLANETYRIGKPIFEELGYGITEEFVYALRLKWLKQPAEVEK